MAWPRPGRDRDTLAQLPAAGSLDGLMEDPLHLPRDTGRNFKNNDDGPSFHYADIRYVAIGLLDRQPELATHLDEPGPMGRQRLLWRLGRPETSCSAGRPRPTSWPPSPSLGDAMCWPPTTPTGHPVAGHLSQYVTLT